MRQARWVAGGHGGLRRRGQGAPLVSGWLMWWVKAGKGYAPGGWLADVVGQGEESGTLVGGWWT